MPSANLIDSPVCAIILAAVCVSPEAALAQESLRNSLAGDAVAAAQREQQQQQASEPYTIKAGDFRLLVVPSLELDYDSNVTLVNSGTQSDVVVKPLLDLTGSWQLTQQNLLRFSGAVGYDEYVEHNRYSALRINSGSEMALNAEVKDLAFNLHDRVSFTEDPSAEAALAGTAQYQPFVNTGGLTLTWDMEDIVLTVGADRQDTFVFPSQFGYLDQHSELPIVRAGFQFYPQLTVGLETSASFTSYEQRVLNDNQSYSAGLFADWQVGSCFDVQPRAGFDSYQFGHTSQSAQVAGAGQFGAPPAASIQTADINSWYGELALKHQINDAISYSLAAGRDTRLGIDSDAIQAWHFRPDVTWRVFKNIALDTMFFYERGHEGAGNIAGNLSENYDWYGGALTLSYAVMRKLLVTLNYRLTLRSSNVSSRSYDQDVLGLSLSYQPQ